MSNKPNKRKAITLADKLNIISKLKEGCGNAQVCREYGLSNSTVSTIWAKRDKFLQAPSNTNVSIMKRMRLPVRNDLDRALLEWVALKRAQNVHISSRLLQQKAEELAVGNRVGDEDPIQFYCNKSWVDRFKRRHNINSSKVRNETAANFTKMTSSNVVTEPAPTYEDSKRIYCRLCLQPADKDTLTYMCIDNFNCPKESDVFKENEFEKRQELHKMLKLCLPFFDTLTFNPVICSICQERLKVSYEFVNTCLNNQRLIQKYAATHGMENVNINEMIEFSNEEILSNTDAKVFNLNNSKDYRGNAKNKSRQQRKRKKCPDECNSVAEKPKICCESQEEYSLTSLNNKTSNIKIEPSYNDDRDILNSNNTEEEAMIKIEPNFIDCPDFFKCELEDDLHVKNEFCNKRTGIGTIVDVQEQNLQFHELENMSR